MFANDLTGLCRSNIFGGDIHSQTAVPFNQLPVGFGQTPVGFGQTQMGVPNWGSVPYGFAPGYNFAAGQVFHPAYGYLFNRIPQGFVPQGFVPQSFVPQGFVPQQLGQVGMGLGHNPFLSSPFTANVPFTNPLLAHSGLTNNIGYGFSPYAAGNWNPAQGFQGLQNSICR